MPSLDLLSNDRRERDSLVEVKIKSPHNTTLVQWHNQINAIMAIPTEHAMLDWKVCCVWAMVENSSV